MNQSIKQNGRIGEFWHRLAHFFESGDLTPLAVLVSVAHYGPVLVAHGENSGIAYIIGTIIDMIHFRTVRRSVSARKPMDFVVAGITTAMALGYHLRFYGGDILLAAPIPVGIAILAYHAAYDKIQKDSAISQEDHKVLQSFVETLQESNKVLQENAKSLQVFKSRWEAINSEFQTLIMVNTGEISPDKAQTVIGVKDIRTVINRAERLNGIHRKQRGRNQYKQPRDRLPEVQQE